jgi:F-type H+-transporting ATPase subunit c
MDTMGRQPEIASELRFTMIIGLAMIESLAIYCLLVSLIILLLKWQ